MTYKYQSRNQDGQLINGIIEASSEEAAVELLQKQRLIIINITPDTTPIYKRNINFFQRVSNYDLVVFSRQLSFLFGAKIPLVQALQTLSDQTINPKFKKIINEITRNVDAGMSLSKSMAMHKDIFSGFYISLIKSGEIAGKLEEVLNYLADFQEREYILLHKIKSSLSYPIFVVFTFSIVIILMFVYVVPQLTGVFKETGVELPLTTKAIIFISDTLRNYYIIFIVFIFALIGGLMYFKKTEYGKNFIDRLKLKIPYFNTLFQKLYLSRFADTFSTMIVGGLPIAQALEITSEVINNTVFRDILLEAESQVKKGSMISVTLKKYQEIPPLFVQMISIGEVTGKLDLTLKNLAGFYQKEIDSTVDNIVSLIEPVLIVVLGIFVAIFVISLLLPIYNVAQTF